MASHRTARSAASHAGAVSSAAISERPQPRHVSSADSYARTSSRSAASAKRSRRPSARSARASATSSTRLPATRAQPPAARSVPARIATHWPLSTARAGDGSKPSASDGPKRSTSVVEHARVHGLGERAVAGEATARR